MKFKLSLFVGAMVLSSPVMAQEAAPISQCDNIMAHAADPDKVTTGLKARDKIDLPKAIVACRDALKAYPDEARFHYQLGAALFYQGGPETTLAALDELRAASDRNYRQATFVLGFIYSLNDRVPQDMCRAGHMWSRTVSQGHPWSKYYIARHHLNGDFDRCSFAFSRAEIDRYIMSFNALDLDEDGERRTAELLALRASK